MSLLLSLSLLASCQEKVNEGKLSLNLDVLGSSETSEFYFKDSSLLDILKSKYEVETKKSFFSEYIKCINDVCANDEYSWVYYLNGEPMNLGLDVYMPLDGDRVLISYKKV